MHIVNCVLIIEIVHVLLIQQQQPNKIRNKDRI